MTERPQGQRLVCRATLVISGLVTLLAIFGIVLATLPLRVVLWNLLLLSIVNLAAGVTGALLGLGRFAHGRSIALIAIAGAVGAGSLMGFIEANPNLVAAPAWRDAARVWIMASLGCAALLVVLAAASALARRPRDTLPRLAKGIALCIPVALVLAGGMLLPAGTPGPAKAAYWLVGSVAMLVFASAGGHFLIRAFEVVGPPEDARPTSRSRDAQSS